MHGTLTQKVSRVVGNLITHPQYISRCISHNVINGQTPLDLEIPWFSYAAIDFLEGFLQPDMTICEYGSGRSSLFFSKRAQIVYFIYDHPRMFVLLSHPRRQASI